MIFTRFILTGKAISTLSATPRSRAMIFTRFILTGKAISTLTYRVLIYPLCSQSVKEIVHRITPLDACYMGGKRRNCGPQPVNKS